MYPAKIAEPIELLFEVRWTQVGARNHVLDGGADPPWEEAVLGWGKGQPIVKYRNHAASVQRGLT